MKDLKIKDIINKFEFEINNNAALILEGLRILRSSEIRDLIGMYDLPEVVDYSGSIYLRSSAIPFPFSDDSEVNSIVRAVEAFNKQSHTYQIEFQEDYDDMVVWCSVLWPIENWFVA